LCFLSFADSDAVLAQLTGTAAPRHVPNVLETAGIRRFETLGDRMGIPVKVNGDSSEKPNNVPVKANSRRSEATLAC
jgi:hypothetical protein